MEGQTEPNGVSDRDCVASVLRALDAGNNHWEALLLEAEAITYAVDMGDIHAVANCDGKLIQLTLQPNVVTDYSHGELAERMNVAFAALADEVQADYRMRFGGDLR
ncbi:MAG: DUF2710 family protein [Mycobacteriaceae bacterium]